MIFKIEGDIPEDAIAYLPSAEYDMRLRCPVMDLEMHVLIDALQAAQCTATIEPPKDSEEYPTINFGG